jgi:hypothetical protein
MATCSEHLPAPCAGLTNGTAVTIEASYIEEWRAPADKDPHQG